MADIATTHPRPSDPAGPAPLGRATTTAAALAGVLFIAEALVSPLVDAHLAYHLPNTLLNAALVVATVGMARPGRCGFGRGVVIGGWATAFLAAVVTFCGAWTVVVEGFTATQTPEVVEGISHTAVLLSLLPMIAIGVGLRRVARGPGLLLACASGGLVAMVLVGLDGPWFFLFPEAMVGVAWLLTARALRNPSSTTVTAGS